MRHEFSFFCHLRKQAVVVLTSLLALGAPTTHAQSKVVVEKRDGAFRLTRDGEPYAIKGVGGATRLADVAAAGGNSIRTWDANNLGRILDQAHTHGLTVCAGLWLGHQRHGFDYQNKAAVLRQLDQSLAVVREHKDHPALLLWGVGNEMEGHGDDPSVWYAVNHIARDIKRIDPDHPVMTVIAELGPNASKVRGVERFCPDVDIIGINSYGGIQSVGERFKEAGATKPYIITEHGPLGPWEAGKTAWGSPIEFSSTEKARFYADGYRANVTGRLGLCLGTYAFLWGDKQETTATWFGMLLPDGSRLEAVDAMTELWTGIPPKNRCPQIETLTLDKTSRLNPGDRVEAVVVATDPERDPLTIRWILRADSGTIGEGGDRQEKETAFPNQINARGHRATITLPKRRGAYRVFAYVHDGQGGAAVANIPLYAGAQ